MVGEVVSHYKILEKLGGGGMGVVYKAQDTRLNRTVALKFLPPTLTLDPEAQERFIHEARAASALDHSNICTIHDFGNTDDGQMFIVMACYEGQTLKKTIDQGPLDFDRALDIAIQIAEGLSRAHEAGIVHRDIKPANIFLTDHSEVKILDFGLAKLIGQSMLTKTGSTLGTAAYMSPEQARGEPVDQRSDIWSLGVVVYEMLTGQLPFKSDYEQALVYAILNEDPKPIRSVRPEVPEVIEQILGKALAKNREERYQTAEELLSDLKIARGKEEPGGTIAAAGAAKTKQKRKLRRRLIAAGLAAAILAVGLFVVTPLLQDQALASHPRGIAFISMENKTGEDSLKYLRNVLPDVLATTLGDSKYVRVTRSDRMRELMKQVGKDSVEFIDRETGLLLCRRAGIDVMCVGSYTKAGPLFLAELELIDVQSGEKLGSPMKARGREVESFLTEDGIVDDLARQVSHGMGVSQLGSQAAVKPVAEVSSSSIEAQRYFQRGKREIDKYNWEDARRFLELAVKEDSTFAIAWLWLSGPCAILGDRPAEKFAREQAVKNASRATEREKFVIASIDPSLKASLLKSRGREEAGGDLMSWVKARAEIFSFDAEFRRVYAQRLKRSGKLTQAIAEYEKALQLDPAFLPAYNELAYSYVLDGQGEKGMQMLERYAELQPGDPNPLHSAAECLLILGRYDEGIAKCEEALKVKPDAWYAGMTLAKLHFLKEDYEEAIKWSARASEMAPAPLLWGYCLWYRAWYLVWSGRLWEAEEALRASEQKMSREFQKKNITDSDNNGNLGGINWLRAWCAYERGDWKKARLHFSYSPELGDGPWLSQFCLGLVDLQEGKRDSIDMRLERIKDTLLAFSQRDTANLEQNEETGRCFMNALKGFRLLAAGRPAEVQPNWTPRRSWLTHLPDSLTAASWPLCTPWNGEPTWIDWIPIPFDILPRAYVERGMIDSAITSYELALKKPPHLLGPIIPRYYYRVAQLYEQKGMRDKAIENYTQFLKVWGKADPVYTEPADARARLARLKRG